MVRSCINLLLWDIRSRKQRWLKECRMNVSSLHNLLHLNGSVKAFIGMGSVMNAALGVKGIGTMPGKAI
jgi:hypothetical protein